MKVHCSRFQVANINTENKTNSKHVSDQPNQLNLKPSDNKFELERKNKQYNDCCDSDSDDEVLIIRMNLLVVIIHYHLIII